MATIKKPKTGTSVTSQTEGGDHPRGAAAKNYGRDRGAPPKDTGQGPRDYESPPYSAGKHFRDARAGDDDLDRDPGIDTSGLSDRDDVGIDDFGNTDQADRRRR